MFYIESMEILAKKTAIMERFKRTRESLLFSYS